jgi:hypothetical protein
MLKCKNILQCNQGGHEHQCSGTGIGTAWTATFCLGTGTGMYSGSGTGLESGSNIYRIQKSKSTFWETLLLLALKRQDFAQIYCCWKTVLNIVWIRNRNQIFGTGTTINHYGSTTLLNCTTLVLNIFFISQLSAVRQGSEVSEVASRVWDVAWASGVWMCAVKDGLRRIGSVPRRLFIPALQ